MSGSHELYVDTAALREMPERFYRLKRQAMEKVEILKGSEKYLRSHLTGSEVYCTEIRRIQYKLADISTTFEQMGQVLENICDLYDACESREAGSEVQIEKKDESFLDKAAQGIYLEQQWAKDYLKRSGKQIVLGNYTEDVTLLGTAGQIALGIFDLDILCDVRDLNADIDRISNEEDVDNLDLALDALALVPVIGSVKYLKNGGKLIKNGEKTIKAGKKLLKGIPFEEITKKLVGAKKISVRAEGMRKYVKGADWLEKLRKLSQKTAKSLDISSVGKNTDAAETAVKGSKAADEAGSIGSDASKAAEKPVGVGRVDKKSVEGGSKTINTLTDAQKSRLKSLENTINDHLTKGDFSGTLRDLQGNPVPNGKGGYFDHLGEMKDSYASLNKIKKGLEGTLKNPNLSKVDRTLLQEGLDNANSYISRIEDMFEPFGGIN